MDYNPRQQRHRGEPKNHPHHLSLPVHRTLCWWPRAKFCQKHFDGQFIFMWNAFATATFSQFVSKICDADQSEVLTTRVGDIYPCRTDSSLLVFCEGVNSLMDKFPFTMLFYKKFIVTICQGERIWI
jgi:hypothetical protein